MLATNRLISYLTSLTSSVKIDYRPDGPSNHTPGRFNIVKAVACLDRSKQTIKLLRIRSAPQWFASPARQQQLLPLLDELVSFFPRSCHTYSSVDRHNYSRTSP